MDRERLLVVILRMAFGIAFLWEGISKIFIGAPVPVGKIITFMSSGTSLYLIGLVELLIGLFLVLGMFTRWVAWVAAGFAFLALVFGMALGMGFLAEELPFIALALFFAFRGCQEFGLDCVFAKRM